MKARALVVLALMALIGTAGFAVRGCAQEGRLSSQDIARIRTASMELVDVTLASRVTGTTSEENSGPDVDADNRLMLRVPAAYVAGVSFHQAALVDRGAPGASSVAFLFWARSFDPVRPDQIADNAVCRIGMPRPCAPLGTDGGRMAGRRHNGDNIVEAQLSNAVSSEARRRYYIQLTAGLDKGSGALAPGPCDFRKDAALGMLVGRVPQGERITKACGIYSTGMVDNRTGRFFNQASFLMREAAGSPRFSLRCPHFVGPDDGTFPTTCHIYAYFGAWQISIWVPSDRPADWNATYVRIQEFLARHTVSRTD